MFESEHPFTRLEMDGGRALFESKVQGIVATCYENERPLQGLAGWLDWRFHGLLSYYLRTGTITGAAGECVYVPIRRNDMTFHLILAGGGQTPKPGKRLPLPDETWERLRRNLASLQLDRMAISPSDLGDLEEKLILKNLKGVPLWVVQ